MITDKRLLELIDLAIQREEEAHAFYMDIFRRVDAEETKEIIEWIAGEEKKHKKFLINYRDGKYGKDLRMSDVVYYKIAEHENEPEVQHDMSSAEVYLVAAHREKRSHQFYSDLAEIHDAGPAKNMLLKMANEELRHKEKMEYLYSNTAFAQTSGG